MFAIRFGNSIGNPAFPLIVRHMLGNSQNINGITGSIIAAAALSGALGAGLVGHQIDSVPPHRIAVARRWNSIIVHVFVIP